MTPSAPPSYDESQMKHGQAAQAPGPPQVQIVREIRYIEAPSFGPRPQVAMCSACGSQVTTSTSKSLSLAAWTIILALCCLQACCCACIPCCLDSCKKVGGIILF